MSIKNLLRKKRQRATGLQECDAMEALADVLAIAEGVYSALDDGDYELVGVTRTAESCVVRVNRGSTEEVLVFNTTPTPEGATRVWQDAEHDEEAAHFLLAALYANLWGFWGGTEVAAEAFMNIGEFGFTGGFSVNHFNVASNNY